MFCIFCVFFSLPKDITIWYGIVRACTSEYTFVVLTYISYYIRYYVVVFSVVLQITHHNSFEETRYSYFWEVPENVLNFRWKNRLDFERSSSSSWFHRRPGGRSPPAGGALLRRDAGGLPGLIRTCASSCSSSGCVPGGIVRSATRFHFFLELLTPRGSIYIENVAKCVWTVFFHQHLEIRGKLKIRYAKRMIRVKILV